ncbi:hypothetical protein STEG23_009738 [Scotinomys teguina]
MCWLFWFLMILDAGGKQNKVLQRTLLDCTSLLPDPVTYPFVTCEQGPADAGERGSIWSKRFAAFTSEERCLREQETVIKPTPSLLKAPPGACSESITFTPGSVFPSIFFLLFTQDSENSTQCLAVDLCIYFHQLLDEGSTVTLRFRIALDMLQLPTLLSHPECCYDSFLQHFGLHLFFKAPCYMAACDNMAGIHAGLS